MARRRRNRCYFGGYGSPVRDGSPIRGDRLGFPLPPMPKEGCHQVLGTMPTDPNVTPPIPDWLQPKLRYKWREIWHSRVKQYKYPPHISDELLPWDTKHSVMGDYNAHAEYYVKGCFGYYENGEEVMDRPPLPGVHWWRGRGLILADVIWRGPRALTNPPPGMFNFYKSTAEYSSDERLDLEMTKSKLIVDNLSSSVLQEKTGLFEDELMSIENDIFDIESFDSQSLKSSTTSMVSSPSLDDDSDSFSWTTSSAASPTPDSSFDLSSIFKGHKPTGPIGKLLHAPVARHTSADAKIGFMNLPGEVRNQIYGYVFEDTSDLEILWCTRGKDLTYLRHKVSLEIKGFKTGWRPRPKNDPVFIKHFIRPLKDARATTLRRQTARRLYMRNNHKDRAEELQASGITALLMTCRQLYHETLPLFYMQHAFSFASRAVFRHFINRLSPRAKHSIKKLYIGHDPQAWTLDPERAVLIKKENNYWIQDLKRMVIEFKSLENLSILVYIRDPHIANSDRAEWAMALRRGLAGLKYLPKLGLFNLNVRCQDETDNITWAQEHGTRTQEQRAGDLHDLAWLVKSRIYEDVKAEDE